MNKISSKFQVNDNGFYGNYGGAYIPELLFSNVEELKQNYLSIIKEDSLQKDFNKLLHDYVGRPTPLYFAEKFRQNTTLKFI